MKLLSAISCLIILFAVFCTAQKTALPDLKQFPVSRDSISRPARIDLNSHPKARLYQMMLRDNARKGINFAGHYKLATWGCGSSCISIAIIDMRNGRVYFPPQLPSVGVGFGIGANVDNALQFNAESRLLIVTGYPFWAEKGDPAGGEFYYVWKNNRLKLIRQNKSGTYKGD